MLVHVNLYARPGVAAWWPAAHQLAPIYGIAVPTFFVLSGYHAAAPGQVVDRASLGRRLGRLGLPFVVWGGLMLALDVPTPLEGVDLLIAAVTGPGQLYYLFALAQLLGAAAWLEPRVSARGLAVGGAVVSGVVYGASALTLVTRGLRDSEDWFLDQGAMWAIFFFVGALLRREAGWTERLSRWWWVLALVAVPLERVYVAALLRQEAAFGDARRLQAVLEGLPFNLCGALALIGLSPRIPRIGRLAGDTFGIYLVHMIVLVKGYDLLVARGWTTVASWETPAVGAAVMVVSWGIVRAARAVGVGKWVGVG